MIHASVLSCSLLWCVLFAGLQSLYREPCWALRSLFRAAACWELNQAWKWNVQNPAHWVGRSLWSNMLSNKSMHILTLTRTHMRQTAGHTPWCICKGSCTVIQSLSQKKRGSRFTLKGFVLWIWPLACALSPYIFSRENVIIPPATWLFTN